MKKPKQSRPPKLTDADRYDRFLEIAAKVEASDKQEDLDTALKQIMDGRLQNRDRE